MVRSRGNENEKNPVQVITDQVSEEEQKLEVYSVAEGDDSVISNAPDRPNKF